MLFLFEKKISEKKRLDLALQECYGLGKYQAFRIFVKLGFNKKTKMKQMSFRIFKQIIKNVIRILVKSFRLLVEDFRRKRLVLLLKNLKLLNSYKSIRHFYYLPVRGQRTKNNAQTQKRRRPNYKKVVIPKKKK